MTLRPVRAALLALATLVAVLCLGTPAAFAASTYFDMKPSAAGENTTPMPLISVRVSDPAGISTGYQIKVDGLSRTPKVTWGPNNSYCQLSYQYAAPLANGRHTVYASVYTGAGRTSTTWTFTQRVPPSLGPLAPADGSTVDTQTPTISAVVGTNGSAVGSWSMSVDGVAVAATYDAASKTVSYKPSKNLTNGRPHAVLLSVTDVSGAATQVGWTFSVWTSATMSDTGGCTECHTTYPASHPMSNCWGCHEDSGPYAAYWNMEDLTPVHGAEYLVGIDCAQCHSSVFPNVPSHPTDLSVAHGGGTDMSGCPCHVAALNMEHSRWKTDAGADITCASCHQSEDPRVQAGMAAGSKICVDCHAFEGGHSATHETSVSAACADAGCHSATNLLGIHGQTCTTCHSSSDAVVEAAIADHDKSCTACHDPAAPHGDVNAIHSATVTEGYVQAISSHMGSAPHGLTIACSTCHATNNLLKLHGADWNNCSLCHAGGGPRSTFTEWDGGCQQGDCHAGALHDNANADANHRPVADWPSAYCGYCHVRGTSGLDYNATPDCVGPCHTTKLGLRGDSTAPSTSVANPQAYFASPATIRLVATDSGAGVAGIRYRYSSGEWIFEPGSDVTVKVSGVDAGTLEYCAVDRLGNVEATKSYTVTYDTAAPSTVATPGHPTNVVWFLSSSDAKSGVAATYYSFDGAPFALYGYFQKIEGVRSAPYGGPHNLKYYSVDMAGNIETTGSVDFVIPDAPPTSKISTSWGNNQTTVGRSLVVWAQDDYSNGPSGVKEIHYRLNGGDWVVNTFPMDASFVMAIRSADIIVPADGSYTIDYYAVDQSGCTEAMKTATILVDHTQPTVSGWATSITGQAMNISATDPAGISGIDYKIDSYNWSHVNGSSTSISLPLLGALSRQYTVQVVVTDMAGNQTTFGPSLVTVNAVNDGTAPTSYVFYPTTSTLNPNGRTYTLATPSMTLRLASWDGAGVASRHYQIDGGSWVDVAGSDSNIAVTGYGTHTIAYYGVDNFGNTEQTKSVTFTIASTQASLSFSMVNARYPNTPMTWSDQDYAYDLWITRASDGATVFLQSDLHTWEGGVPKPSNTISFSGGSGPYDVTLTLHTPLGGDQEMSWTVDGTSGSVETLLGDYDEMVPGVDVTPPVTTSDAEEAYVGGADIVLTATDDGSGIETSMYTIDGGETQFGDVITVNAPVSGSESHTITFWSVDRDGNTEDAHTVTFTVSAP